MPATKTKTVTHSGLLEKRTSAFDVEKILPAMAASPLLADLTTCLSLLMGVLGGGSGELTWQVDKALCKALDELLKARRHLRSPRSRSTAPVEEEEPATAVPPVPRPNSTPEAAARTAEEAAAAKAARRNKKNKARRARRKRKHAAMNNKTGQGGDHGGDPVSLPDYIAWTSTPKPPAAAPSTEPALGRSPRPVTPLLPLASQPLPGVQAPSSVPALSPQWARIWSHHLQAALTAGHAEDCEGELGHHTTQLEKSRKRALPLSPPPT